MKYLIVLTAGILAGVALFAVGMIYNPLAGKQRLSPLSVTDAQTITFSYPGVAAENIVLTNNGELRVSPYPEKVLQLWEASIRHTSVMALPLRNARGQVAGLGIKYSSLSEKTRLLEGEAIVDSVWYLYLPGRGSLFIEQYENHWDYLRGVVFPAYGSAAKTWEGSWLDDITSGPGALGTARVFGGSGEFENIEMLGVESLAVQAWSVNQGPVAADGRLTIEIPADTIPEDEY